jgi:hypothetical protein
MMRNVRVSAVQGSSVTSTTVTLGKIAESLGAASNGCDFKVLAVKAWNISSQAKTSNYIRVTSLGNLCLDKDLAITGEDYGNSASLPGVGVNIPDPLADLFNSVNGTTATTAVELSVNPTGVASVGEQVFLVEFLIRVKTN